LPGLRTNAGSHATLDVFNKCGRVFWLHVLAFTTASSLPLLRRMLAL
jgi:hypothetical protein